MCRGAHGCEAGGARTSCVGSEPVRRELVTSRVVIRGKEVVMHAGMLPVSAVGDLTVSDVSENSGAGRQSSVPRKF